MTNENIKKEDEISLKDLITNTYDWFFYLISYWKIILFFGLIGGLYGYLNSKNKPIIYTAKLSFILEDGKSNSSGLGGLASLAGQFGVDVGGGAGGGILSGDNIMLYFKSPSLSREVLLSYYDTSNKETIADVYARVYQLNEDWEKNKKIGKIRFGNYYPTKKNTRIVDSLLQSISGNIIDNQFYVSRPEKKASFLEVKVSMTDEILAKKYCEQIVQIVVNRYITSKIQRQKNNVDKLQARADSVASLLLKKTVSSASLQNSSSTMDINPLFRTGTSVAVETSLRDKTLLSTIFASVTQSLEIAKFALSQETPVIQIIDNPILPLKKERVSKLKTAFLFSIGFSFAITFFYILSRLYRNIMK